MDEKVQLLVREYQLLWGIIFKDGAVSLKQRLFSVLYLVYKRILKRFFLQALQKELKQNQKSALEGFLELAGDFGQIEQFWKEIDYVRFVMQKTVDRDLVKQDQQIKEILFDTNKVIISKFSQKVLQSILEEQSLVQIASVLATSDEIQIIASDEQICQSYTVPIMISAADQ